MSLVRHLFRCLWLSLAIITIPASADHLLWKYNFSMGDKVTVFAGEFVIVLVFTLGISRLTLLEARQPWRVMHELRNWLTVIEGRIVTGNMDGAREAIRAIKMLLDDGVEHPHR